MTERVKYDVNQLVQDLKKGYEPAFDYLFTTRYEDLCRFARAFVGSYDVAEDIVQDVFARIWENNLKISSDISLDSYLYVAVRNGCVSYARRQRPHVGLEALSEMETEEILAEDWKYVWDAVESLPEQCRVVLKLVVLEDMKYAEAAEKLDISVNTVKTQMKIAYRELRKKFTSGEISVLFYYFYVGEGFNGR